MKIEDFSMQSFPCQAQEDREEDTCCLKRICNVVLEIFKSLLCCCFSETQLPLDGSRVSQLLPPSPATLLTYEEAKIKVQSGDLLLRDVKEEWKVQIAKELVDGASQNSDGIPSVHCFRALFAAWKACTDEDLKPHYAAKASEFFDQACKDGGPCKPYSSRGLF